MQTSWLASPSRVTAVVCSIQRSEHCAAHTPTHVPSDKCDTAQTTIHVSKKQTNKQTFSFAITTSWVDILLVLLKKKKKMFYLNLLLSCTSSLPSGYRRCCSKDSHCSLTYTNLCTKNKYIIRRLDLSDDLR